MYWNRILRLAGIGALCAAVAGCDRTTLQRTFSADPQADRPSVQPTTSPNLPTKVPSTPVANAPVQSPAGKTTGLQAVPASLQPYVNDVAQLKLFTEIIPTQSVTRATFARWLVETNNRIYRDRNAHQIRLASTSKPAFQDVSASHADFAYIQGLAEAGYLPSPLSGDNTQARFRPNDPLTRETLLLWKVPVDRQQILPTVTAERVKQLWGFKDANRITPLALSAIAADRQNGDLSNIRRVFGSTLLFQPQKPVSQAEATAALWFIGIEGESLSVQDLLRSEQQAKAQQSEPLPESATPIPSSSLPPSPNASP
jgi:S-layer homology domain